MDSLSMILLTIPIFFPIVAGLDFGLDRESTAIWFGILVLMAFAGGVGPFPALFPTGGYQTAASDLTGLDHAVDVLNHMVLPFFVLTVAYLGEYSIIMRNSLIDVMGDDFIQTARAKGVREKQVLWRHAVPNALLPTVTLIFLNLGQVVSGVILVETVFSWPGLGQLFYSGLRVPDLGLVQGLFVVFAASVILMNLLADLVYPLLDPRVRP